MYSFTLDSETIKEIREYNADTGYSDWDLTCESETGKYCTSSFIDLYASNDLDDTRENWNEYDETTGSFVNKVE